MHFTVVYIQYLITYFPVTMVTPCSVERCLQKKEREIIAAHVLNSNRVIWLNWISVHCMNKWFVVKIVEWGSLKAIEALNMVKMKALLCLFVRGKTEIFGKNAICHARDSERIYLIKMVSIYIMLACWHLGTKDGVG